MGGIIHERTTKTLLWLDFYGLCREAYLTPFATQKFLDEGAEGCDGVLAELEAAVSAQDEKSKAGTDAAGAIIMGIGGIIIAATGESGVGAIVGLVVVVIGVLVKYLARLFYVECDKYHCGGYNRSTATQRNRYKQHQQGLVGVYLPNRRYAEALEDCSCQLRAHRCYLVRYMHDGMMVNGINFAELKEDDEASLVKTGRVRGANAYATGGNQGCTEWWRKDKWAKPLDENGKDIPKGDPALKLANDTDSYYYRAYRVRHVLWWMQEHVLCRTMECMEDVLANTYRVEDDNGWNQKRRRGSRWYASIVWMMKDIWEYSEKIEKTKPGRLAEMAKKVGASDNVIAILDTMKRGKEFDPKELPWVWWPFLSNFTFWQLHQILIEMKEDFPWERKSTVEAARAAADGFTPPVGEKARKKSKALKPMILAIKQPIRFMPDLRPVPAKYGTRHPGWGILAFGGLAALLGGYTIYKVVSEKD
jgi:hypothetical protein